MTSRSERARWDEAAALEELERLQRGIEEWRRRRNDAQAEFDRFVRGFRRAGQAPEIAGSARLEGHTIPPLSSLPVSAPVPLPAAPTPAADAPSTATVMTAPTPIQLEGAAPPPIADAGVAPIPSAAAGRPERFTSSGTTVASGLAGWLAKQSTRRSRVIAGAGALAIVIVAGALLTRPWQNGPDESPRSGPQSSASSQPVSRGAVPPAPQHASQPADAAPPRSEIVALQRVWVRVVVDGTREVERELAAGERVPLQAGRASVIRAGNAGAVRVTINGEDRGTLGPEGEPITRTLRPPAAPAR